MPAAVSSAGTASVEGGTLRQGFFCGQQNGESNDRLPGGSANVSRAEKSASLSAKLKAKCGQ
jgi:hypothetical protein